ncbi:MAG TPA: hypothetical protein VGQ20_12190 [Acidimicrobiales bacterium]|nr:hypothetical protein [Acidimicrobiales bacterium]
MKRRHRAGKALFVALLVVGCGGTSARAPVVEAVAGAALVPDLTGHAAAAAADPTPVTAAPIVVPTTAPPATVAPTTTLSTSAAPAPVVPTLAGDVLAQPDFQPGVHAEQVVSSGLRRDWTIVVPPGRSQQKPAPLLIALHGVGGKGINMRPLGFEALAAEIGAIVAYPDAAGGSWNDGRPGLESITGTLTDDIGFFRTLIDETARLAGADPKRVAVVGFSNGAMMASRVACELSDRLVAVALVSGGGQQGLAQACKPARPTPMLVVFGTSDRVVPYTGGEVAPFAGKRRGIVAPVVELLNTWLSCDHCRDFREAALPGTSPAVTEFRAQGCPAGIEIVHYRVEGGGHEWTSNAGFSTTTRVWEFFKSRLVQ